MVTGHETTRIILARLRQSFLSSSCNSKVLSDHPNLSRETDTGSLQYSIVEHTHHKTESSEFKVFYTIVGSVGFNK